MRYVCEKCGKWLSADDIGYLGPRNRGSERHDPLLDTECVCKDCEFGTQPDLKETI